MNIETFTVKSREALQAAQELARSHGHQRVEAEHLLIPLFQDPNGIPASVAQKVGVDPQALISALESHLKKQPKVEGGSGEIYIGKTLSSLISEAESAKAKLKDEYLSTEHLLLGALLGKSEAAKALNGLGLSQNRVFEALKDVRGNQRVTTEDPEATFKALDKYTQDLTQRARQGKLDPVVGRDEEIRRTVQVLSMRRKNNPVLIGEPGVGKTAIAEGIAQRIVSEDVPEGLKGKRLLSLDLGSMIAGAKFRGEFEERLKAVLKEVTSAEGQIVLFIDEIHTLVGAGASEGSMDASNMLKPALARGDLHCIGATTVSEYRKYIEKDAALERRFQPVWVEPPSVEETLAILRGLQERYEVHHKIRIRDAALVAAAQLSDRYISDRFLPDKAIDLVDEAASSVRMEVDSLPKPIDDLERRVMQLEVEQAALEKDKSAAERLAALKKQIAELKEESSAMKSRWRAEKNALSEIASSKAALDQLRTEEEKATREGDLGRVSEIRYGKIPEMTQTLKAAEAHLKSLTQHGSFLREEVTDREIAEVVSRWTGIPVAKMLEGESERLVQLESRLHARVIGQDEAVSAVARAVRRARAGLKDPRRPIGSFLFLGPTGVGKTELAKTLAEQLFNDEDRVIRIDMTEYMEKHAVSRLIGAPPGYVGYDQGGMLTEAVRRHPYSVILLDEIEKAHPEVFNVLLQVMDDGRLTDGKGRTVNMSNTVLIMTSNLGSEHILGYGEGQHAQMMSRVQEALSSFFRPEFLNRVDDIIVFHRLKKEEMRRIVPVQLAGLETRLAQRGLKLEISPEATDWLADIGYDPQFGARPLKRVIQSKLVDPIAMALVEGQQPEAKIVQVALQGDALDIQLRSISGVHP